MQGMSLRFNSDMCRRENGFEGHFRLDSPATSERIRLACEDVFTLKAKTPLEKGQMSWSVPA